MIKKRMFTILMLLTFCLPATYTYAAEDIGEILPLTEVAVEAPADLGGASITMLAGKTRTQIVSFLIESKDGSVIIVDGGLKQDAGKLAEKIMEKGGKVSAWFITHAHADHSGALAEIITNENYDIEIDMIYSSFPTIDWVFRHEAENGWEYVTIADALKTVPEEKKVSFLQKDDQFQIDEIEVTVLNQWNKNITLDALNNSSIVYSMVIGSKKMLFLGDLGIEGGKALLESCTAYELKSDMVQMSHHGQANINFDVYQAISPETCFWPTPSWLWHNNSGEGRNSGQWTTLTVRQWMRTLKVQTHLISKDGDQTVY